jgi:hypothetical protein
LPLLLVPLTPEALDGDDGGELLIPLPPLPEEKDVAGEGILPFWADARVAGAAAACTVFIDGCCFSAFGFVVDWLLLLLLSFLFLFRDQKDIFEDKDERREVQRVRNYSNNGINQLS